MIKNKKGSMGGVAGGLTLFLLGIIMLFLSFFITSELGNTVNESIIDSSNLEDVYNSSANMIYVGLTMMSIAMIIMGALVIFKSAKSLN